MAIVTPIWEPVLPPVAQRFVRRSIDASSECPQLFVAPESLDTAWYQSNFPESRFVRFHDRYFTSSRTYSHLLTEPQFYAAFHAHEFITICQTDAVLVDNPALVGMENLDYLGAPWNPPLHFLRVGKRLYVTSDFGHGHESRLIRLLGKPTVVGNGGLSIRRVDQSMRVTHALSDEVSPRHRKDINEDALLCTLGPQLGLRIASPAFAESVFLESQVRDLTELPSVTGFHGLERWNPDLIPLVIGAL